MYSYGSLHMAAQKQDDQHERTFTSYVRIQAVVLKTYLGRWTIGRSGERGSGISVLPARYDDDDDIYIYMPMLLQPKPQLCREQPFIGSWLGSGIVSEPMNHYHWPRTLQPYLSIPPVFVCFLSHRGNVRSRCSHFVWFFVVFTTFHKWRVNSVM